MKILNCACMLALFSTPAFASDFISSALQAQPDLTPFEVLQNAYQEAYSPANLEDIDLESNHESNQHCVSVVSGSERPFPRRLSRTPVILKKATPAIPEFGPLFPAKPAEPDQFLTLVTVGMNSELSSPYLSTSLSDLRSSYLMVKSSGGNSSLFGVEISLRKKNDLIFYKVETENAITGKGTSIEYGYCYRE